MHMAPDAAGAGAAEVRAGAAIFARREHTVRFERLVQIIRGGQVINADNGMAHLTAERRAGGVSPAARRRDDCQHHREWPGASRGSTART